jgi:hypothetical protein
MVFVSCLRDTVHPARVDLLCPVLAMGPRFASEALRLIADSIDAQDSPSISAVAGDLREVVHLVESPNSFGSRVAILDTLKGLKRKLFNTKGERKILDKIDRLKELQKECARFVKQIRRGLDFDEMSADDKKVAILLHSVEFMTGGSRMLDQLAQSKKPHDVVATLGEMDEYYDDEEDDEEKDRKVLADAVSDFYDKSEKRIEELEQRVSRQKTEQKKGGRLKRDEGKGQKPVPLGRPKAAPAPAP